MRRIILFMFCMTLVFILQGQISFNQVGDTIKYSDISYFGKSVDIDMDGNTIVASTMYYNGDSSNVGLIRVYELLDSNWVQKGQDIVGNNKEKIGKNVRLNATGDIFITSTSEMYNNTSMNFDNKVKIYEFINGQWQSKGSSISFPGEPALDINADGNTLILGGYNYKNNYGLAMVYTYENNGWQQKGDSLRIDGYSYFGYNVSINGNGNVIAVGDSSEGKIYLYTFLDNNWIIVDEPINSGCWGNSEFDLNYSGDKIVLTSLSGSGSCNNKVQSFLVGTNSINKESEFDIDLSSGLNIRIDSTGNKFVIANQYSYYFKYAPKLFEMNGGEWIQYETEINNVNVSEISISGDGKNMIVGLGNGEVLVYSLEKDSVVYQVSCDSFEWYGNVYNSSGIYTIDSTVYLNLNIYPSYHFDTSIIACDFFKIDDSTYENSGDYNFYYQSKNSCDSILNLSLRINKSVIINDTVVYEVITDLFKTESPRYNYLKTDTFSTVNNCDSIVLKYEKFIYKLIDTSTITVTDTNYITKYNYIDVYDSLIVELSGNYTAVGTQFNSSTQVKIYPNPTQQLLTLEVLDASTTNTYRYDLYNVSGQNVITSGFLDNEIKTIDLSNLPNGVYYINFFNLQGSLVNQSPVIIRK